MERKAKRPLTFYILGSLGILFFPLACLFLVFLSLKERKEKETGEESIRNGLCSLWVIYYLRRFG